MDESDKKLLLEARDKVAAIMENLEAVKGPDYRLSCEAVCSWMQFRNIIVDIKLPSELITLYDTNIILAFDVIESGLQAKLNREVKWDELVTDCQTILNTLIIYRKKS